ncbi:response regulator [Pararhizobium sp. O133]|uniref:response regulator n=1 Tax=Pararhizobium sp. O133 TaxID=3449278 RepID=UPI003F683E87
MKVGSVRNPGRKRVLLVEDEALVAMLVEDFLTEMGFSVVGPAMRLEPALQMAATAEIDFAVLDINLAGKHSFPIAQVLRQRGIPFLFASGYGVAGLAEGFETAPVLQKPFDKSDLEKAILSVNPKSAIQSINRSGI